MVQLVQKFTANKNIEHLTVAEHETEHNLINLRQICNLRIQRLFVYLGLKWWISFVVVFPTIADFLLFLVVLHGLYTTQHKRNANYKRGRGTPQNRHHQRRKEYFLNADLHIFYWIPRLSISTRAYFKYACFKTTKTLEVMTLFWRSGQWPSRLLSSSTTSKPNLHGLSFIFPTYFRLPDRVINKYGKYNRPFRKSNRQVCLVLLFLKN